MFTLRVYLIFAFVALGSTQELTLEGLRSSFSGVAADKLIFNLLTPKTPSEGHGYIDRLATHFPVLIVTGGTEAQRQAIKRGIHQESLNSSNPQSVVVVTAHTESYADGPPIVRVYGGPEKARQAIARWFGPIMNRIVEQSTGLSRAERSKPKPPATDSQPPHTERERCSSGGTEQPGLRRCISNCLANDLSSSAARLKCIRVCMEP